MIVCRLFIKIGLDYMKKILFIAEPHMADLPPTNTSAEISLNIILHRNYMYSGYGIINPVAVVILRIYILRLKIHCPQIQDGTFVIWHVVASSRELLVLISSISAQ